jgi:small-conductance mechanosensitive channel
MSDTVTQSPAEPDAATIAHIQAQLTALRAAGMLSPEGCRLLARAEAVEAANREMAELKRRLEESLRKIDEEAVRARGKMQ